MHCGKVGVQLSKAVLHRCDAGLQRSEDGVLRNDAMLQLGDWSAKRSTPDAGGRVAISGSSFKRRDVFLAAGVPKLSTALQLW